MKLTCSIESFIEVTTIVPGLTYMGLLTSSGDNEIVLNSLRRIQIPDLDEQYTKDIEKAELAPYLTIMGSKEYHVSTSCIVAWKYANIRDINIHDEKLIRDCHLFESTTYYKFDGRGERRQKW